MRYPTLPAECRAPLASGLAHAQQLRWQQVHGELTARQAAIHQATQYADTGRNVALTCAGVCSGLILTAVAIACTVLLLSERPAARLHSCHSLHIRLCLISMYFGHYGLVIQWSCS